MRLARRLPAAVLIIATVTLGAAACESTTAPTGGPPPARPAATGSADNASHPGEPVAEPSTFLSLGIRWPVVGDANADAAIAVSYRPRGESAWREAMPLFRTDPESVSEENRVPGGWLFAGSIVDLVPDTEYEVALALTDPDGGSTRRTLTMRTAAEPREPPGMRVRHVVPAAPADRGPGSGAPGDPFRGLRAAQAAAAPGDLFLLHAGVYAEGTWTIDRFGTAERPIIYRGAGDGEAILDGGGRERLVSATGVQHVWLEGLTLRRASFLFVGHSGSHFVVRHCRLEVVQAGITAINGGYDQSRGFVITDNVLQGPTKWPRSKGIEDINGILITGAGHVVAYNRMRNLGDGIHGTQYGRLSASDIYNNDIEGSTDDGIEGDNADTNVRIFRNRITNVFSGISAQPSNGGPMYIFRNVIYNTLYSPFKLHDDTSGVLIFHNTSVRNGIPWHIEPGGETVNDVVTRNNLFVGTMGPALRSTGKMIRCDFDGDGYGGAGAPGSALAFLDVFAEWNGQTYSTPDSARRSGLLYGRRGAVLVKARGNFASGIEAPGNPDTRFDPEKTDFRLNPASLAVDAGVVLPSFNDGFTGKAPDLGCCELGQPLPHYGPRP
jgi:Right handed beta helix region